MSLCGRERSMGYDCFLSLKSPLSWIIFDRSCGSRASPFPACFSAFPTSLTSLGTTSSTTAPSIDAVVSNTAGFYAQADLLFCRWVSGISSISGGGTSTAGITNTNASAACGMDLSGTTTTIVPINLLPYSPPCPTAAQVLAHIVQPMARFWLALDAWLCLLHAGAVEDEKNVGRKVLFSWRSFFNRFWWHLSLMLYACAPITRIQERFAGSACSGAEQGRSCR
ncbi:hypothetical protein M378DRAFT_639996 [Amanita muscaria Koide BX008]|uniref:Uncharacterized protein n=1 Tax=Amanita muscaria (strain Koide BX008) TaxID=946122 RepID=A0A0C2WFB1_AMAMK|nr:hypothetical protein M378DRAFT_639996 [Amanita muscaria Koide BX008]